jgi:site-specific DNA-methyltransferase (adenine-specific)/modification methylase
MTDTYDAADNSRKCYDLAIETMREKLESFRCERIGPHVLYLGDCREILPLLPRVDAVVTDPPYGVLSASGSAATRRSGGNQNAGVMAWDVAPAQEVLDALRKRSKWQMVWGGCHLELPQTFGYLVWDKKIDGLNFGEVEFCWTNAKFAPRVFRFRAVGIDGGKEHPTQKPIQLMCWCLGFLPDAKTVLDPFMGSGTTGVACHNRGLRFTGIELEPKYFDIACRRIDEAMKQPDLFIEQPVSRPVQLSLMDAE